MFVRILALCVILLVKLFTNMHPNQKTSGTDYPHLSLPKSSDSFVLQHWDVVQYFQPFFQDIEPSLLTVAQCSLYVLRPVTEINVNRLSYFWRFDAIDAYLSHLFIRFLSRIASLIFTPTNKRVIYKRREHAQQCAWLLPKYSHGNLTGTSEWSLDF